VASYATEPVNFVNTRLTESSSSCSRANRLNWMRCSSRTRTRARAVILWLGMKSAFEAGTPAGNSYCVSDSYKNRPPTVLTASTPTASRSAANTMSATQSARCFSLRNGRCQPSRRLVRPTDVMGQAPPSTGHAGTGVVDAHFAPVASHRGRGRGVASHERPRGSSLRANQNPGISGSHTVNPRSSSAAASAGSI